MYAGYELYNGSATERMEFSTSNQENMINKINNVWSCSESSVCFIIVIALIMWHWVLVFKLDQIENVRHAHDYKQKSV